MSTTLRPRGDIQERLASIGRTAATLREHEIAWRDKQRFLEERGYMLRPRFHPEWVPSWVSNGRNPMLQEDFESLPLRANLIDAARTSDGKLVYVKRVKTGDEETQIIAHFSQPPQCDDPRNHCVPLLDSFADDEDPTISYIVMPFLRPMDDPEFYFVNDIIDCVDQLLEGLAFIHEHHVAHRDCAPKNILMDASNASKPAPFVPRLAARPPVKYYYVDFGISSKFDPEETPKLAVGIAGRDQEVPELSTTAPYNPFKVDVFIVGNVLRKLFYEVYSNIHFLLPLIELMMQKAPENRVNAQQALEEWHKIRKRIWFTQRARRLRPHEETGTQAFLRDVHAFFKLGSALSRRWLRRKSGPRSYSAVSPSI